MAGTFVYLLEQLYHDQDREWVFDTIPAVIALLSMKPGGQARVRRQPHVFELDRVASSGAPAERITLELRWTMEALVARDAYLQERIKNMRSGRTPQREHVVELAGYGLALVAISVLLPGQRVADMERGRSPDFVLDMTPGALRGVEVACRTEGGWPRVREVRKAKTAKLVQKQAVSEAHLSVWCAWPRVTEFCKVKP